MVEVKIASRPRLIRELHGTPQERCAAKSFVSHSKELKEAYRKFMEDTDECKNSKPAEAH